MKALPNTAPTLSRPSPPLELRFAVDGPGDAAASFIPSPELGEWARTCFLDDDGPLFNAEHGHLRLASILFVWTNVPKAKNGREIWAEARLIRTAGDKWAQGMSLQQLRQWNDGALPDFLITVDAPSAAAMDDPTFGALVDHELYHCSIKLDENGTPDLGEDGNDPAWTMRGHDVEQFVGVVRRWGARASGVAELVAAAGQPPLIEGAAIVRACGTCRG
ncbi:MAG TPA: putative metallopeptidase [Longimicrobium sp.]|nr:putative metallopeptidase [Longimicrobium sp.]